METTNGVNLVEEKSVTDSLIDGLAAGIIAGLGMGLFLILAEWVLGEAPASILKRFVPWENPTPLVGGLLHLAVSSVYGMIFGGLVHVCLRLLRLKLPIWLLGLVYGVLLFLLARFVILPGVVSTLQLIPAWLFALAHLVYGSFLGWWSSRQLA